MRGGFVARAITYGLIGAIAFALALGAGSAPEAPNQQGALALIGKEPLGRVAVAVIAVGLLAYALWKFMQAIHGRGPEGGGGLELKDRVANAAGGVAYVIFFVVALRVLMGTSTSGSSEPRQTAGGILAWPGGPLIVGIGGAALIAISAYQAFDALRGRFADDAKVEQMKPFGLNVFLVVGLVGLVARALVFAVIGYFLVQTAIDFTPGSAVGVDGALAAVHGEPYGPLLLGLVASGLLIFAAFSLLEARYRQL